MQYNRSVEEMADALGEYVRVVKAEAPGASILLVSPIHIDDTTPKFAEYYQGTYGSVSAQKSRELAREIKKLADERGVLFFDASTVAHAGKDGIHFDKQSHDGLAKSLSEIVKLI